MEDNNGIVLTDFKDIITNILRFYGKLVGTRLYEILHVDINVLRKGD